MLHSRRDREGERGQMLVLFELVLIIILMVAALVIDIGLLRNDRQTLVNAVDSAALAGGSVLPVAGATEANKAKYLIDMTMATTYPGLPAGAYTISYRCLIGADASGTPLVSRDVPATCDPSKSLGRDPVASDFRGAGPNRVSSCNPYAPDGGDMCNVVVVEGVATQQYFLAPVAGVSSGSTGTVSAAACKGPCGQPPTGPVDLVIILDRTLSMAGNDAYGNNKILMLKNAAKAVLSVYNPAQQHVALALTGPGKVNALGVPQPSSCGLGAGDNDNWSPLTSLTAAVTSTTATTIQVGAPKWVGFPPVPFTIAITSSGSGYGNERMRVTNVSGTSPSFTWTVTRAYDGTTAYRHRSGDPVYGAAPWTPSGTTNGIYVPVGLSGSDASAPLSGAAGTYQIGGVPNTSSTIVKAINCIAAYSDGTNLATPIRQARWYLDHYGRKGVTQGIILETDGHPQVGFASGDQTTTNIAHTCVDALAAATEAKNDTLNSEEGIQVFTIGYGVDSTVRCPTRVTGMTISNTLNSMYESAYWNNRRTTELLAAMATDASHYFENPPSSQLASVFTIAAVTLIGGGPHLIDLYPAPIVSGVGSGTNVTISGKYFSGATSVFFGGLPAVSFSVSGDGSIAATAPGGSPGATVDVTVQTPGGISVVTPADRYTFP
jgi:hypothetical protein